MPPNQGELFMERSSTLTDGTPIQDIAARLVDRARREDALAGAAGPSAWVLARELAFLRDAVLELPLQNLKDAVVLTMAAHDAAAALSEDGDGQDAPGRLAAALARLLRLLADAAGVDIRDAAGDDFLAEDDVRALFPELALPAAG
jgi:hypothetical protein